MIDRNSPLPLYWQLKAALVEDIAARELNPGDRLASDHQLCAQYGVSRTVVRQALRDLELESVIRRDKGRGTFVGDKRTSKGFGHALTGTFEDIQTEGNVQESITLFKGVIPAPAHVANELNLAEGDEVVFLERLRLVDGAPWAVTQTHLPMDIGGSLLGLDLRNQSIYGVLEREFGIKFDHANRSLEAEIADSRTSELLTLKPGAAVLVMHSVSYDPAERPIEHFVGLHRGDRSRLDIHVTSPTQ